MFSSNAKISEDIEVFIVTIIKKARVPGTFGWYLRELRSFTGRNTCERSFIFSEKSLLDDSFLYY